MYDKDFIAKLGVAISDVNHGFGDLNAMLEFYHDICTHAGYKTPNLSICIGNVPYRIRGKSKDDVFKYIKKQLD